MKLGVSEFATNRHIPGAGHSYSSLTWDEIVGLTLYHWVYRVPGDGVDDLDRKIVVPILSADPLRRDPPATIAQLFHCGSAKIPADPQTQCDLHATVEQRGPHEDTFVSVSTRDHRLVEKANFVKIICYSAAALLENGGRRSTDCDWEIVSMNVSAVEKEPMHPLAMARNFLEKPGGTKSDHTAQQFAESIYYHSQRVAFRP